jgi:hypothetical protein
LTEAEIFQLIKSSTDGFYSLQIPTDIKSDKEPNKAIPVIMESGESPIPGDGQATNENSMEFGILHNNAIYETTARCLDDLLKTILDREMSNEGLSVVFKHLESWIISVNDHERLRSIRSLSSVLKHFAANFKLTPEDVYYFYILHPLNKTFFYCALFKLGR